MVGTFGPVGEGGVLPGLSGGTAGDGLLAGGGVGGPGAGGGGGVEDVAGGEGGLDALQRLGGDGLGVPLEELMRLVQLLLVLLVAVRRYRRRRRHLRLRLVLLQVEREREVAGARWSRSRRPRRRRRWGIGRHGGESTREWLNRRREALTQELGFPLDANSPLCRPRPHPLRQPPGCSACC